MKKLLALLVTSVAIATMGATPKVATSHVTKSGSIVMLFVGTDPTLGPVTPGYITKLAGNPNINVNGLPVAVQGPFWSSVNHMLPWVAYQLPFPVRNVDVVTWQAGAGWLSTSQGLIGADTGTAINYVGQLEPGVFGYQGFNDPTKTVRVGFNGPSNCLGNFCFYKNAIHRSHLGGNSTSSTPDGYPLTIGGGFAGVTKLIIWQTDTANGLDNAGYPCPQGVWTLLADETAPTAPMNAWLGAESGIPGPRQPVPLTITPGKIVNGVELGKSWTWSVNTPSAPWNLYLELSLQTPTHKAGPNTLRNLRLFEPGNAPVADPQYYTNDNFVRIASPASWAYPEVMRFMEATAGSDGASSIVTAEDLTPLGLFNSTQTPARASTDWPVNAPTFRGNRMIHLYSVRPYDLTVSPNVYFAQQYGRCLPVPQLVGVPSPGNFRWSPADSGLDYGWMWNSFIASTNNTTAELVTADVNGNPQPHNLSSGQFLTVGRIATPIPVANPNGAGTAISQNGMVWVTSPTTFIMNWSSTGMAPSKQMANVTATTVVNVDATFTVGNGGLAVPPEAVANVSNSLGKGSIWVAVNHCANDGAVTAFARRLFSATQRGTKVYVQFSNEITIPNSQYSWPFVMGSVQGLTQIQAVTQRTAEVIAIFRQVFASDPGTIVGLFQNWTVQPQAITQAFQYAQAKGLVFDGIAMAGYVEMDNSPSFAMSAAAICANDPRSIANPANGGSGVPMPMAGHLDLYRHWLKYTGGWNGPTGNFAKTWAALAKANYTLSTPRLVFYECGPVTAIPPKVSLQTRVIRAGLSHDASYDPAFYDVVNAFLQLAQCPGPIGTPGVDLACIEALTGTRGWGGSNFTCPDGNDNQNSALFAVYDWQGQRAGFGLNNRFWGTDGAAHDMQNESPRAKAYMDWLLGTNPSSR